MKKYIYISLLLLISVAYKSLDSFTIKGYLKNLGTNKLIYTKVVSGKPVFMDTIEVINGKFEYSAEKLTQSDFRYLVLSSNKKKAIKIFIDNEDVKISGDIEDIKNIKVISSNSQAIFTTIMSKYSNIKKKSDSLRLEMKLARYSLNDINKKNTKEIAIATSKLTELDNLFYSNEAKKSEPFIEESTKNPNDVISAWALLQIVKYIDYKTVNDIYNKFSPKVKKSHFSKKLELELAKKSKMAIGSKAPSFSSVDMYGNIIDINHYKGKYVLLYFWSPTCYYCREENPKIMKLYKKYSGDKFEIIGINTDEQYDEEIWKLVIEEDKLSFPQLLDTVGIADKYDVEGSPYNILIDDKGNILNKNIDIQQLYEILKKNIFEGIK